MVLVRCFGGIGFCIGRSHKDSQCASSVRASYKPLYTRRFIGDAKQGLINQCRRRRSLDIFFFAAHDRYRLRSSRRGVAVARRERNPPNPPQRRLYAGSTVSFGTSAESIVGTTVHPAVSTRMTGP